MSAKQIFEHIRDIPYRLPEFLGDEAPQCAAKSEMLIKELSALGYEVRTRIAEMNWADTLFPKEIVKLYPKDITATHMFVEIFEEGIWRALDGSWDSGLKQAGFPIAEFDGKNSPGIKLVRLYDFQEQEQCLNYWSDPEKIKAYFERVGDFAKATNKWFEEVRKI